MPVVCAMFAAPGASVVCWCGTCCPHHVNMSAALCHARRNTTTNQHRGLKLQKSLSIEQTQDKTGKCCFFGPFRWKNARQQSCRVFHQLSKSVLLASVQPPQLKVHWIGDSCRQALCEHVCSTLCGTGAGARHHTTTNHHRGQRDRLA